MDEVKKTNSGVCCDVCECVHNLDGCNCEMDSIKVTKGKENKAHFCKTFCCK